jgi:hypothetical protein
MNRIYGIMHFEDRAAGFSNEHRAALVVRLPPDDEPLPPIFV